jgi:cytochrome c
MKGAAGPFTLEVFIDTYMPGSGTRSVSTQEAANLAAYIRSDMPSAARGKVLYESTTYACATCHGADGSGGTTGYALSTALLVDPVAGSGFLTIEGIANKIKTTMPQTKPALGTTKGSCNQACANDIAKYIWTAFP